VFENQGTIMRGEACKHEGKMRAVGDRVDKGTGLLGKYAQKSDLSVEAKRVAVLNGDWLLKFIFSLAKYIMPEAMEDYEDFTEKFNHDPDNPAGALFITHNYQASAHVDNDRTEFAIGYVMQNQTGLEGDFFYPSFGFRTPLTHNCLWGWRTQEIHGTARMKEEKGSRFTCVLTLSERTARGFERKAKKNQKNRNN